MSETLLFLTARDIYESTWRITYNGLRTGAVVHLWNTNLSVNANLMCRKAGYDGLMFEKIGKKEFEKYVAAVQSCANKDYKKMIEFITSIFPS